MDARANGVGRPAGPQEWTTGAAPSPATVAGTRPGAGREAPPQPAPRLPSAVPDGSTPVGPSAPVPVWPTPERRPRRPGRAAAVATLVVAVVLGGTAGVTGALLVVPDRTDAPTVLQQQQRGGPGAPTTDVETAARSILQSVVQVRTAAGSGSGFVIDASGHVLTNHHVVDGSSWVRLVLPDGTSVGGRVVGSDEQSDIAVIEASGLPGPAVLGTSADLRIGQQVIAVGSPLGLNGTVTSGIVSAVDRATAADAQRLVQTDASINPGNSGGPLVDAGGRVVGVNSSIATVGQGSGNIGIGFAVPIDDAARIAADIIRG
ncbi:S1C family serine protease [Curtobacterium sp. BH-2-1-1]|uniref:S1C family serine protease n=1 Tax=Curtobacterium sp. BH-2-1-1 TaxID=1905847 RepID=UPI0009F6C500|nr:trypsin-like peptidase domain-containing protein [Curtobacterium sp. BH-2-1-1]